MCACLAIDIIQRSPCHNRTRFQHVADLTSQNWDALHAHNLNYKQQVRVDTRDSTTRGGYKLTDCDNLSTKHREDMRGKISKISIRNLNSSLNFKNLQERI